MEIASNEICLQALRTCALSKRRGLAQEVAIMLAVLTGEGVTIESRKACADLYDAADEGFNEASGRTFRAIRPRVDACVALHDKIGHEALLELVGERRGVKAIGVITDYVASLSLFSIDAIYVYCGKREVAAKEPEQTGQVKTIRVKTKHIVLDIPEDIDPTELEQFGMKLLKLAEKARKERRKDVVTPVQEVAEAQ